MADPVWIHASDGRLINTNHIASATADTTGRGQVNISLVTGETATLPRHVAAAVWGAQRPHPPQPVASAPAGDTPAPQTDQQWLLEQQRRVGRTIDPLQGE